MALNENNTNSSIDSREDDLGDGTDQLFFVTSYSAFDKLGESSRWCLQLIIC